MAELATTLPRLELLIRDAFHLRSIIAQNAYDGALRRDGITFRYLIDTPVFNLYGEPGRLKNCKRIAALPSLIPTEKLDHADEEADDDDDHPPERIETRKWRALVANALLTSEYIFKLSDSADLPILVSPEHTHEIISYVDNLERRGLSYAPQSLNELEGVYSALKSRLELEAEAAATGADAAWLKRVRNSIMSLLAEASRSPLLAPYRLRGLFSGKSIVNLVDGLELRPEVISPPLETIMRWRSRIETAKAGYPASPTPDALHADAVTLAQLELVNRDWRERKELCVLVTWDRGLTRAYAKWRSEGGRSRGAIRPNAIRDPRQYTPILNISDMSGGYTDGEIFDQIADLVSDFTSQFYSTDLKSPDIDGEAMAVPDMPEIRAVIGAHLSANGDHAEDFTREISSQLHDIDEEWVKAIEYSVVAKADVISALASRDAELWTRARSRQLLTTSFADQIDEVRESFEILTTSSTLLRQELWAIQHGPQELTDAPGQNRRALASTFEKYKSPAFAGLTLNQILENIRGQRVEALQMLREANRAERLFITGCLSLQIGAWMGAKALLDRAKAAIGDSRGIRGEVEVFRSMARRLVASRRAFSREYRSIRKDLANLRPHTGLIGVADDPRVRNEQLALELCEIAFRASAKDDYTTALNRASQFWNRMNEKFGSRLAKSIIDPYWQSVGKQFILNTFDLLFWQTVADEPDSSTRAVARSYLDVLAQGDMSYVQSTVHGRLYPLLAEYALEDMRGRPAIATRIADGIARAIARDEDGGIAFDLPYVDKAEFAAILALVAPDRSHLISKMQQESFA